MKQVIQEYLESGLSVIPISEKGKNPPPGFKWGSYREQQASVTETQAWSTKNIAVIGGYNGVSCIDIDSKNDETITKNYWTAIKMEAPELFNRLVIQKTPSGGYHLIYRCSSVKGNQKLASDFNGKVIIETRGDGGYFLVAPSQGYKVTQGKITELPELTTEEQSLLFRLAQLFNTRGCKDVVQKASSPLDEYDKRVTDTGVIEMLTDNGWKVVTKSNEVYFLCRPGKESGLSATYNYVPHRLFVFSTSTEFEPEHTYKPSAIHAVLNFGGDFSACARDLFSKGYGKLEKKISVITHVFEFEKKIDGMFTAGTPVGFKTGTDLDSVLQFFRGYLYVCGGKPGHGKSTFHDWIMVRLAQRYGLKFDIYSPESAPVEQHFQLLAEKYRQKPMFGTGGFNSEELKDAKEFVNRHFGFIPDDYLEEASLDWILNQVDSHTKEERVDGFIIDPFNELESHMPSDTTKTDYIGSVLKKLRHFARKHNMIVWILTHPKKPSGFEKKDHVPRLYDLADSANWKNKADVGYTVYRDCNSIIVNVEKVKFKWLGKEGRRRLDYNKYSSQFISEEDI